MKMPHWPSPLGYRDITLGLERVEELLRRLGNPEQKLPPVIHVAGTNGKGSTIAFLRAILEAAGKRVHVYTSPHLVEFNERIVLAGEKISDVKLTEAMARCRVAAGDLPVSFFEGTTAGAFTAFAEVPADIVLLETGMGGRLDATNVIAKPALTIITPIGLDHTSYLGDTVAKIAYEKACIMKPGVTCITAPQAPEAMEVLQAYAKNIGAELVVAGEAELPELALEGPHQRVNAGVAVAAYKLFRHSPGFGSSQNHRGIQNEQKASKPFVQATKLTGFVAVDSRVSELASSSHEDDDIIIRGLASAQWPARLQHLRKGKLASLLPKSAELWLDGGHNPAAAAALAAQAARWRDRPLYLVTGMMGDKDGAGFFRPLAPYIKECIAVPVEGDYFQKQAKPASLTAQDARAAGMKAMEAEDVAAALSAIAARETGSFRVLICGSLYLAGRVLAENGE